MGTDMSQLIKHTPKLWERSTDRGQWFSVWCEGCQCGHPFRVKSTLPEKSGFDDPNWSFNGNHDSPTFRPSLLNRVRNVEKPDTFESVCHLHVTDGNVEFLNDCSHVMAGKTVPMSNIPENYGF
jgi:hypothetical protein